MPETVLGHCAPHPTPLLSPPPAGTWTGLKALRRGDGSEQAGLEPPWKVET